MTRLIEYYADLINQLAARSYDAVSGTFVGLTGYMIQTVAAILAKWPGVVDLLTTQGHALLTALGF